MALVKSERRMALVKNERVALVKIGKENSTSEERVALVKKNSTSEEREENGTSEEKRGDWH